MDEMTNFTDLAPCPVIDAHAHCFPDPLLRAIRAWFEEHAWQIRYCLSAKELAAYQLERGLARQVLLSYAHKPGVARELNRFLARTVANTPGSLGLAAVHPDDNDPAGVLDEAWQQPGLVGAKLHLHVLGRPLDDPSFFPIYQACLEAGRVINIHAGTQPASPGYGLDVTEICGTERTKRILEQFKELRLIIPHLGWDETETYFSMLEEYPGLVLDTTMILADYFTGVDVDLNSLEYFSHRIMYGSDFPNIPYEHTREVRHILGLSLGREALENILWRTADRVFGFGLAETSEIQGID